MDYEHRLTLIKMGVTAIFFVRAVRTDCTALPIFGYAQYDTLYVIYLWISLAIHTCMINDGQILHMYNWPARPKDLEGLDRFVAMEFVKDESSETFQFQMLHTSLTAASLA